MDTCEGCYIFFCYLPLQIENVTMFLTRTKLLLHLLPFFIEACRLLVNGKLSMIGLWVAKRSHSVIKNEKSSSWMIAQKSIPNQYRLGTMDKRYDIEIPQIPNKPWLKTSPICSRASNRCISWKYIHWHDYTSSLHINIHVLLTLSHVHVDAHKTYKRYLYTHIDI